jgi:hypothetical protein
MKRTISIFLTTIVLLVMIQPTLVFHYCDNSLRYVKLLTEDSVHCCCSGVNGHEEINGNTNINGSTNKYAQDRSVATDGDLFLESFKSCCSFYIIGISTDDFNLQQEAAIDRGTSVAISYLPSVTSLSSVSKEVDKAAINLQRFLPGETFYESRELLSMICAFLI